MLIIIWIIFAMMFLGLGMWHWIMSGKKVLHIDTTQRPTIPGITYSATIGGMDIDQPIKDFVAEFNKYVDNNNQMSSKVNKMQAIGYWVA